jgi:GNAT superfamily N-acetyltransferase
MEIDRMSLSEVTPGTFRALRDLYAEAYHDPGMYESFVSDVEGKPEVFQLFAARDSAAAIVGAIVVESSVHASVDYRGFPPVHSKRFCVRPELRGQGVGARLLAESRRFCFEELGLKVSFGISNEIVALSLHGREGALFSLPSIEGSSPRNGPRENLGFFAEFLTNPKFKSYRIPAGEGVRLVYCRDVETAALFEADRHLPLDRLLDLAASR